jgi:hypothetical protein
LINNNWKISNEIPFLLDPVFNLLIPITDLGTSLTLTLPFNYNFGGTTTSSGRSADSVVSSHVVLIKQGQNVLPKAKNYVCSN